MKILIAEDNEQLQVLVSMLMDDWDYDFDLASNGRKAVELAKANEGAYDLCLMDIDMPVMNGIEAAKIIRREVMYFPIIAVTGNPGIKDSYLKVGIDDILQKPYFPDELYTKISELTTKVISFEFKSDEISIKKEMPMDQQHANELRELAKRNLRKVKFFDNPGSSVIVHKNVTNRISHDFNVKKQLMTVFINRDPEKPTLCELFKDSNYLMPQTFLTEEEYTDLIQREDKDLENYPKRALKETDE